MHQVEESNTDLSHIMAGSALVIRDLTEWPEDGCAVYHSTGSFASQGEEYLQVIEILLSREAAWAVSQAYEAFETFLKDITATYLRDHPQYADSRKLKKATSALEKSKLERDDIEYWKMFVRLAYRKGNALFEYLRELAPELGQAEQHNNRAVALSAWFAVVSEVRHATTHSNLVIKRAGIRSLSEEERRLLSHYFPGKTTGVGYELHLDRKNAETAFQFFAEYAFIIFKYLSRRQNYDWMTLLKPSDERSA